MTATLLRAVALSLLLLLSPCSGAQEMAGDDRWLVLTAPQSDQMLPVQAVEKPRVSSTDQLVDYLWLLFALVLVGVAPTLGSQWGIRSFGRKQVASIPAPPAMVEATAVTQKTSSRNALLNGGRQISSETVAMIGRDDLQQRMAVLRSTLPAGAKSRLLIAEAHLEHGQMRTATQMIEQLERESRAAR